jgi:integrase
MPEGLTPHSLRRTFASLLFANAEQPPYVKRSMGHTSANLTRSICPRGIAPRTRRGLDRRAGSGGWTEF